MATPLSAQREDPVLIPIHSNGSTPEWAMIEINGELILPKEMPDGKENPADDSNLVTGTQVELGAVRFVDEKPVMVMGSHQLTGSVEKLKQPFCVLQKQTSSEATSYQVKGVVTHKLLFNNYPKTIMR